ncbi:604_t:CDS:2 [Ambispora leptoticha]|uniref:604_t:CDS:1 n=1 Tax=Ambispora leptoticha TaxID=144679 RepID=A0A9N8ZXA6_9GLOM|nr:604_t:CDS:2 [Ambispora leptoticha]
MEEELESVLQYSNLNINYNEALATISSDQASSLLEPISTLADNLVKDPDRVVCKDGYELKAKIISDEDWEGLEELCDLLNPFARASVYISENRLTHSSVFRTHQFLRKSMLTRWKDPKMFGWLAITLDSRFKSLTAASSNPAHSTTTLDMATFFDDEAETSSPVDVELQIYFSIPQIPKV